MKTAILAPAFVWKQVFFLNVIIFLLCIWKQWSLDFFSFCHLYPPKFSFSLIPIFTLHGLPSEIFQYMVMKSIDFEQVYGYKKIVLRETYRLEKIKIRFLHLLNVLWWTVKPYCWDFIKEGHFMPVTSKKMAAQVYLLNCNSASLNIPYKLESYSWFAAPKPVRQLAHLPKVCTSKNKLGEPCPHTAC